MSPVVICSSRSLTRASFLTKAHGIMSQENGMWKTKLTAERPISSEMVMQSPIFICSTQENPTPQLCLQKPYGEANTHTILKKTSKTAITFFEAKATCNMSKTCVCSAEIGLSTETSEQGVDVRVRSPPQPCNRGVND